MSLLSTSDSRDIFTASKTGPTEFFNWRRFIVVIIGVALVYTLSRVYMHQFAYSMGLDYFEPEFATFWMPVLYGQLIILSLLLIGICSYLWKTRELEPESVSAEVELQRYFTLIVWLVSYTFIILILGPLAGESDAAWHQVVIRDTDFTPTHIALFYFCVPAVIISGVGSLLYAKTRLPQFSKQILLPFGIAVAGPILVMPNVGFNEWGHTFFYAEELFAAPVHYGFAFLGLALLALGGVVIHIIGRMKTLIDEISAAA